MNSHRHTIFTALLAAALFGITTPLAKTLLGSVSPFMLAGLFYLGSGSGLAVVLLLRRLSAHRGDSAAAHEPAHDPLRLAELPWLAGAIAAGGVAAPALLMFGLNTTPAATSALLLNLEGVLTALIAWVCFRENFDAQIAAGMLAIVAGGALLSWPSTHTGTVSGVASGIAPGALLVALACLCWAIDNNLTRKVSTNDAMVVACAKGLVAGPVNIGIALAAGAHWPAWQAAGGAMAVGFAGYGVSLVLFVVSLRHLGTARTGAYFSVAPLFGVALSLLLWPERPAPAFWFALALMAFGVWLHVRERHDHTHTHEPLEHTHAHRHDEHHRHEHDFAWDGTEPHTHPHRHAPITHSHAHYPDVHHRHAH